VRRHRFTLGRWCRWRVVQGTEVAVDRFTWRFPTPRGPVDAVQDGGRTYTSGPGVPGAVIHVRPVPSLPALRNGVEARVGTTPIRIWRPRYGLRRRERTVLVEGSGISWCAELEGRGRWSLRRRRDGSIVVTTDRRRHHFDPGTSAADVSLAAAVIRSGLVETSSLLAYVSLP
jgi:hypothetical protein